ARTKNEEKPTEDVFGGFVAALQEPNHVWKTPEKKIRLVSLYPRTRCRGARPDGANLQERRCLTGLSAPASSAKAWYAGCRSGQENERAEPRLPSCPGGGPLLPLPSRQP